MHYLEKNTAHRTWSRILRRIAGAVQRPLQRSTFEEPTHTHAHGTHTQHTVVGIFYT